MDGPLVLVPIIGTLSFFGCLGFVLYLYFKTRHKERMTLIEHGMDATIFNSNRNQRDILKWGMVVFAIGLALFGGHFLEEHTTMDDGAGYFALIFTFGGIALLLFYRRMQSFEESEI